MIPEAPLQPSLTGRETHFRRWAGAFAPPIFNKRREAVAVFSNQPDSLRAGGVRCVANAANSVVTAFPDAQRPSQRPCQGGIRLSMLPGFRFLFAAIVLSMSILVFGLGAAALLRAAHEQFASNPSWRAAPETMFAQPSEATRPVLAMLRVEPAAAGQKPNAVDPRGRGAGRARHRPRRRPNQPRSPRRRPRPEQTAALKRAEAGQLRRRRPRSPKLCGPESPAPSEAAAPAQTDAPAAADTPRPQPPAPTTPQRQRPRLNRAGRQPPAADLPPPAKSTGCHRAPAEPTASTPASPRRLMPPSTKIATLGGPPVSHRNADDAAKAVEPTRHETESAIKKRQRGAGARPAAAQAAPRARGRRNWRRSGQPPASNTQPVRLSRASGAHAAEVIGYGSSGTGRDRRPVGQAPFGP